MNRRKKMVIIATICLVVYLSLMLWYVDADYVALEYATIQLQQPGTVGTGILSWRRHRVQQLIGTIQKTQIEQFAEAMKEQLTPQGCEVVSERTLDTQLSIVMNRRTGISSGCTCPLSINSDVSFGFREAFWVD